MAKPKFRPPSKVDALTFPVFGLSWFGTPSAPRGGTNTRNVGTSVIAYCGGGGSAKTGVGNKITVDITTDAPPPDPAATDAAATFGGGGSSTSRQVLISTGEALCFGIHVFRPHDDTWDMIRLLATVGDEIYLYGIPLFQKMEEGGDESEDKKEEAILLGKINVGQGYGAGAVAYTPLNHGIAVGCENGIVVVYHLKEEKSGDGACVVNFEKITECHGHTKALCSLSYHPRGKQILSSAKDGTARVFSAETGKELAVMECEVHDPNGPPPPKITQTVTTKDPRMMKRPPQILVRGCSYGDLEGKTLYTVASGKRGAAYLTKWKALVPLNSAVPPNNPAASNADSSLSFRQEYRIQCSPVPISAVSISSDYTLFALGSVDGCILLYDVETQKVMKQFEGHDLPVTCLASRPVPNMLLLPGEEVEATNGGVSFDAVSASADNRLGRWTLQKKSRKVVPRSSSGGSRKQSAIEKYLWSIFRIPFILLVVLMAIAVGDTLNLCGEEVGLSALMMDANAAMQCVYREVLWAEGTRPGVRSLPE